MGTTIRQFGALGKIDNAPVDGLLGVADSLGYLVQAISKHFDNNGQSYGLTANNIARGSLDPIIVTGGNDDWGTEIMIHDGTVVESGDPTKKFDIHEIEVVSVGTANRLTFLEFSFGSKDAGTTCTFTNATEKVDDVAHGRSNGDKIMFSNSGGALPAELNDYTVYYIINKTDDAFEVSLTSGGAAVTFTDDGTGTNKYHTLTQTFLAEHYVSKAAQNTDDSEAELKASRESCDSLIWVRAKAKSGVNQIDFLIDILTYVG